MTFNSQGPAARRQVYVVEIDGKRYDIEGDRPPSEAEARQAVGEYTQALAAHTPTTPARTPGRGAVSRFLEPIGEAAKGLPAAAGLAAEVGRFPATAITDPVRAASLVRAAGKALIDPQIAQGRQAAEAFGEGRYSEAAGHGAAAALPILGPAAADIGETAGEGNIAGALGQSAVLAAPYVPFEKALGPLLRSRAATQALEAVGPGKGSRKLREILRTNPDLIETLGVGTRDKLRGRAAVQRTSAGEAVGRQQSLTQPVSLQPAIDDVLAQAAKRELSVPGAVPKSGHRRLTAALRNETILPAEIEAAYVGRVPAGEAFKLREQIGERAVSAFDRPAGSPPPVSSKAPADMEQAISRSLHKDIAGSKEIDAAYSNWNKIHNRLSRAVDVDLNAKGRANFGDYLKGRIASTMLGVGGGAAIGGIPGAAVGGVIGATLAKSAFWHSLKATTYAKMARYINAGNHPAAFTLLSQAAREYAADEAMDGAGRSRKAQEALRSQAEGVVAP